MKIIPTQLELVFSSNVNLFAFDVVVAETGVGEGNRNNLLTNGPSEDAAIG